MRTRSALLLIPLILLTSFSACTNNSGEDKSNLPVTIFEHTPPDPRTDQVKIDNFIVQLEKKYKREAIRNPIDLHFLKSEPGHIQVKATYDNTGDPTLANSITDAALDLAKRLKREDPEIRDVYIQFDRLVEHREE